MRKTICSILAFIMTVSLAVALPSVNAYASEEGITLSDRNLYVPEGGTATFTAALPLGYDATRLTYTIEDSSIASVTPVAYSGNVAGFCVNYIGSGSTVVAVVNIDDADMVAYLTVNTSGVEMDVPTKLGTYKDNYCTLISYEFVPYDAKYGSFNDYKYTLNLKYQCTSYKDTGYNKWGCYGTFYDAKGNAIKTVHLYASTLSKGKVYHSEFNVPTNAVKFSIEGKS